MTPDLDAASTSREKRTTACALVFCYNEEAIVGFTLEHYLSMGIDVVVFDNRSTDRSLEVVESHRSRHAGKVLDIVSVPTEGYEWQKILRRAGAYMHDHLSHFEWILLVDADSIYVAPARDVSLVQFVEDAGRLGANIIDGALYEFFPTERDDVRIDSPIERLHYFERRNQPIHAWPQQKIFSYHPTIDFSSDFGHICRRSERRVHGLRFQYRHYKWLSYEHGLKKIFQDRVPRFVERRDHARYHPQYLGLLPLERDLVKPADGLEVYDEEEELMSADEYHALLAKGVSTLDEPSGQGFYRSPRAAQPFWTITEEEWSQQRPYADGLPQKFHFLMTDFCNADCIFCNQDFQTHRQISLDDFDVLLSHIPPAPRGEFVFSGGGEPMLNRDLIPIIRRTNERRPETLVTIKSNGLLVGKLAEQLADVRVDRLGMSVHGSTKTGNNAVLRARNRYADVFSGLERLNKVLGRDRRAMRKIFYFVASRANIHELPSLVRRAAELQVDEVMVMFSRYYPAEFYASGIAPDASPDDSLFHHQQLYDDVVRQSRALATELGVHLRHEALFSETFTEVPCFQPWNTIVINWDGAVFPCTGGEVWFRHTVRSGAYDFGNLLRQHLSDLWNNEAYTKIRRTLALGNDEDFVAECRDCHNTGCLKGPNYERSHILRSLAGPWREPVPQSQPVALISRESRSV